MAALPRKLTVESFRKLYGNLDQSFEYWCGEAIPKSMPTWIHGLLQRIVMELLTEAGYIAAAEVELRIADNAHPRPDVIATKTKPELPYPTKAVEIVVEIASEDDKVPYVRAKCRAYQEWGFGQIYLIDPSDRSVLEWSNGSLVMRDELAGISVGRIWSALDQQLR